MKIRKVCIYLIAFAVLLIGGLLITEPVKAATYSGRCGKDVRWSLDTETGVLEIYGTGDMYDNALTYTSWRSCRSQIKTIKIAEGVTSISERAFDSCENLTTVEMGEGLVRIGNYAFFSCYKLNTVYFPDTLSSIGTGAFRDCYNLDEVWLPADVYFDSSSIPNDAVLYVWKDSVACRWAEYYGYTYVRIYTPSTLYFIVPKVATSPQCWKDGIYLCYSNDYTLDSFTKLELTPTSLKLTPDLKTDNLIPGTYTMYSITLTEEEARAIENATYVALMNNSNTYRTYINGSGNLLKAPIGTDTDVYSTEKTEILDLDGYTFVMNNEVELGTGIQGYGTYMGYWDNFFDVSVALPSATAWEGCWDDGVYLAYSNDYTTDSFTKILMEKTNEGVDVESLTEHLVSGRPAIYTVTLTEEQMEAIEAATYVVFMNEGGGYRTYINGKYNILKAASGSYSDTYSTTKANIADRTDEIFIICNSINTNTSIEGAGTFAGYWADENVKYKGTCGQNINWSFDEVAEILKITGTGEMSDYTSDTRPWKAYVAKVNEVRISEGVTSISAYAFYNFKNVTSIELPESITSIGAYAFGYSGLHSLQIPYGVTAIDDYTFQGCTALTFVEIPNSVTAIGIRAFDKCSQLTSIEIPDSVTNIGIFAFSDCTKLTSVEIPYGVIKIEDYLFTGCKSLESVIIPSSVTTIGHYVFRYCHNLESLVIPEGVQTIGNYIFYDCTSLEAVYYPESVTSIGTGSYKVAYVIEGSFIHRYATGRGYKYKLIERYDLYFVVPKPVTSPKCWDDGIFLCYSDDYALDSFTKLELTKTARHLTPDLKSDRLISDAYEIYKIRLTEEQAEAINNATYVALMNNTNTYRTYISGKGNLLKAPIGTGTDAYNTIKTKIEDLDGYTFIMNGEVQLGTSIQGYGTYTGYWDKFTTDVEIKVVVPAASAWENCWKNGIYLAYSNDYATDSFTKLQMTKTDEYVDVTSLTDQLVSGSYAVYTITLTTEQVEALESAAYVVFMNEGNGYRTYINEKYNILKAAVDTYSDTYAATKAGILDRANHTFIVCGGLDTNTSVEGYGTFTGYWKADE